MRNLANKRVLITGAAGGIGGQTALAFAREGAELIITDLAEEAAQTRADEIRSAGGRASAYGLDVTDSDAMVALRERIHSDTGPVDVIVANAGVVFGGAFLDVPLEKHLLTYKVNTLGLVATAHVFLPDLISQPEGHLVNIGSASAFVGLPYGTTYASSKWSVVGFSESIRLELLDLGHRHVGVTAVCPSYADTGMFEGVRPPRLTRMLTPERIGQLIVAAVKKNKPFVIAPPLVHIAPALRGVLPLRLVDWVGSAFGTSTSMKSWRGHGSASPSKPN